MACSLKSLIVKRIHFQATALARVYRISFPQRLFVERTFVLAQIGYIETQFIGEERRKVLPLFVLTDKGTLLENVGERGCYPCRYSGQAERQPRINLFRFPIAITLRFRMAAILYLVRN